MSRNKRILQQFFILFISRCESMMLVTCDLKEDGEEKGSIEINVKRAAMFL